MIPIDWPAVVKQYHALGLWHAVRYLAAFSTVRDPSETAKDVVQGAWLALWRKQTFSRALFVTVVMGLATNAVRAYRPIELRKGGGDTRDRSTRRGKRQERSTSTFPVQVFGVTIDEVTMTEDVKGSACGDE